MLYCLKRRYKYFLLGLIILAMSNLYANPKADSLVKELRNYDESIEKADLLIKICKTYAASDRKAAISYGNYALNLSKKINFSFEFTYLNYLAQQPGGLTDAMFYDNIFQSNRERNWFEVNWLLYNFQFSYDISDNTNWSINSFILDAHRYAVGFRSNRVDQVDSLANLVMSREKLWFNQMADEDKKKVELETQQVVTNTIINFYVAIVKN